HTIGAIIPTMENAIFARGLQAFQETLDDLGYTLLVSSTAYRPDVEAEQIRALVARGADGLLLIGYERDQSVYEYLERQTIPTLVAWAYSKDSAHPSIGFDNRASMQALAEEVVSMGHRRIAVISGIVEGNDRAAGRLQGIKDAMVSNGLDPSELPVIETPYEIENGSNAFEDLWGLITKPTVVMCGNDVLAVGAIQRAIEMGIRIPDDVSVTGFDDLELARIVTPRLTTVHVPHRQMGHEAARELIQMVEGKSQGKSQRLECALEMRESLRALG
ncbi:MAG: substrate-binding domain-containing protein, partial [Silicimonas sp.]|nr:substrate-binding domain-containing protein [Silicimonas sp.]